MNDNASKVNAARSASMLVAFVCIAFVMLNVWLVMSARLDELAQLRVTNEKLAGSIADQVDSSFLEVEHMLGDLVYQLEQNELKPIFIERLQPNLVNQVARVAQIGGIFLFDATGRWLVTSEAIPTADLNNSDRDYFIFHRNSAGREAHLGLPVLSRSTGEWVIPMSRRINNANGDFSGVVLASLKLSYFRQVLEKFKIGKDGANALIHNKHILVGIPYKESDIGKSLLNHLVIAQASRIAAGSHEERSVDDNVYRIISFDHASNFDVVAVVGVGKDESLQKWQNASFRQTLVVLLMCVLTVLGGMRVVNSVHLREQAEHQLRLAVDALASANESLANLASEDALTGIPNRRFFDMRLLELITVAQRSKCSFAIVMMDVDYFKAFNDRYGHVAGDECLKKIAGAVRHSIKRPEDFVARYGGEEFGILLPNTNVEGAHHVAESARLAVESMQIEHLGSPYERVTVSLGVSVNQADESSDPAHLLGKADRALYSAKDAGRNQVAKTS